MPHKPNPDERLLQLIGPECAEALSSALANRDQIIKRGAEDWTAKGYTDALLFPVVIEDADGEYRDPQQCIAKLCPPDPSGPESAKHRRALRFDTDFADKHLVKQLGDPVTCPGGRTVILLEIASGTLRGQQLSKLDMPDLARACGIIRSSLLTEWIGSRYVLNNDSTLAGLLKLELGPGSESSSRLPEDSRAAKIPCPHLSGPSHGDVHADNVLIPPARDNTPDLSAFRLIDLATFERRAPISRDIATLLVSILVKFLPTSDWQQGALISYLVDGTAREVNDLRPLFAIVDELTDVREAPFAQPEKGWLDVWQKQLQVSLLAQAIRHIDYESPGPDGRAWCEKLATRLLSRLLPSDPGNDQTTPVPQKENSARNTHFVNRDDEVKRLTAALRADGSQIIVVHGPAGLGKSELVNRVLVEYGDQAPYVYKATQFSGVEVKTLVDDLMHSDKPARQLRHSEPPITRLKKAVEEFPGSRIVIVIESAEYLLDSTGRFRSPDMDETLNFLSTVDTITIKVILVSRRMPESDLFWGQALFPVQVYRLSEQFFDDLLTNLGLRGRGPYALQVEQLKAVHQRLRGNPRLAMLLQRLLVLGEVSADQAISPLSDLSAKDTAPFLVDKLMRSLPTNQGWVMWALAAFGTPVDDVALYDLLQEEVTTKQKVQTALDGLTAHQLCQLVRTEAGKRYTVPYSDIDYILASFPGDGKAKTGFMHNAADVLNRHGVPIPEITRVADLDFPIAEVNVLLRAKLYGAANELMASLDEVMHALNCPELLLSQREIVRDKLDDDFGQMQNYNALGGIYLSISKFADARNALDHALAKQRVCGQDIDHLKIYLNRAALHWETNDIKGANKFYSDAVAIASENEDKVVALQGLADCHRRWGQYADAIEKAGAALDLAMRNNSARAVVIALKSARWHAELGRIPDAVRLIEIAEEVTARYDDDSLKAACLDTQAECWLTGRQDMVQAKQSAREAVGIAANHGDPLILLQARTTLCFIHLLEGDMAKARDEIDAAAKLRRTERSLLVLALQALVWLDIHPAKASGLFDELAEESIRRRSQDDQDFAAWTFEGIARCGRAGPRDSLTLAIKAFKTARRMTPPTPGLTGRLEVMVNQIARCHGQPDRFQRVLKVLGGIPE